jgi:hypothetical protein
LARIEKLMALGELKTNEGLDKLIMEKKYRKRD